MCKPTNGVYAASLTPLTSKLEPNISKLIDHVTWLIESGADGVALLGSTGEANSLTLEQRLNIIKKSGIIILATPHKAYKKLKIGKKKLVIDIWGLFNKK